MTGTKPEYTPFFREFAPPVATQYIISIDDIDLAATVVVGGSGVAVIIFNDIEANRMDKRKQTGRQGEEIAALYLLEIGYQMIQRNWRCSAGEVDLIVTDGETLVFVEVRTRNGMRFGRAEESITPAKQARLIELAQTYLQECTAVSAPSWRIDVVAVQLGQGVPQVNHIENAVGW